MFLRSDQGFDQAGGTATLSFGRPTSVAAQPEFFEQLRNTIAQTDWAPDLGAQIGSATWWRGAATCAALIATTWVLSPGFHRTIIGDAPAALGGAEWDQARAQSIAPLALGADTGVRMAANDLVAPLAETPERPIVDATATLGQGDTLTRLLQRAGVGENDATTAARLIGSAVALGDIKPGTRIDMTLGRRPSRDVARPLEQMAFRARFDLNLALNRQGNSLSLDRQPIAIDHTPMRIQGLAGSSLYRSARAAGAPAKVVEAYIKAIASRISIGAVRPSDPFDIIIEQARAATGEVQTGQLLFAGIDQGARKTQLMKWTDGSWYEAKGQSERTGTFMAPVSMARITSSFGLRFHPLLGFTRMHKGIDIGAAWGTPIHAPADGTIAFAGRSSGYGNFIKLLHGGGVATGYGHLSRFAVQSGTRVSRGQVIGYVGSTGMSTGPHLHWEVWKNGVAVNPKSFSFSTVATLSGQTLRDFKAKVAALLAVKPGAR